MKISSNMNLVGGTMGGLLIGFSSTLLLTQLGHISGMSGIVEKSMVPTDVTHSSSEKGHVKREDKEGYWTWSYVSGLLAGGYMLTFYDPACFSSGNPLPFTLSPAGSALAGALVGFGTRTGCGCTSGHGIMGLPRRSMRSLAAVGTFMFTGGLTTYICKRVAVSSDSPLVSWIFAAPGANAGFSFYADSGISGVIDMNQ